MTYLNTKRKDRKLSLLGAASALALSFAVPPVVAQDGADEDVIELDEIVVTGSRIKGAIITSQTVRIDRAEIDAHGFNSIEDILSSLPQNYSGLNSASTSIGGSGQAGSSVGNGQRFQGQSAANLRGLGENNVLILVNGRRQAGSTSIEFESIGATTGVNLSSIPFSAIERIEIMLDGASSIYGSDAIGGVINIILKKNYSGFDVSARYESGENGGDSRRVEFNYGKTWDSGSLTFGGSWKDADRISAADAGFTTFNRTDLGGGDNRLQGQPGLIYRAGFPRAQVGQLGIGDDGSTPLSADDLAGVTGRLNAVPVKSIDNVPEYLGSENENWAFTVGLEQELSDDLKFYTDLQFSRDANFSSADTISLIRQFSPLVIPTSNAFNDTGEDLLVFSWLYQEALDGIAPMTTRKNADERIGLVAGLTWDINSEWRFDLSAGFNQTRTEYDNNMAELNFARLQELANSSDPDVAFNPFGNGTAQNDISSAYGVNLGADSLSVPSKSTVKNLLLTTQGKLFDMWGGAARIAFGGEYREESISLPDSFLVGSGVITQGIFADINPSRTLKAAFAEISLPFIGEGNVKPGLHRLELNFSGRVDSYSAKASTESTEIDNEYSEFSPRVGLAWYPLQGFKVHANWAKAFRAPSITQLFQARRLDITWDPFSFYNFIFTDPFLPDGVVDPVVEAPSVDFFSGPNNNVQGETSESWSVGFDWNIGLLDIVNVHANYSNVEITNQIDRTYSILRDPDIWVESGYGPLGPDNSIERDADGFITSLIIAPFNVNGTRSETLDFGIGANLQTDIGSFRLDWSAAHVIKTEKDIIGVVNRLGGTDLGLPKWSHIVALNWNNEDKFGATLVLNHTGSYDNLAGTAEVLGWPFNARQVDEEGLSTEVGSYTTLDLTVRYNIEAIGTEISAGAVNLTNASAPYYNNLRSAPFDIRNIDPRGRRLFVRLKKSF